MAGASDDVSPRARYKTAGGATMSMARRLRKIAARREPEFGPGFWHFLMKHLARNEAQRAAGISNEQARAMDELDRWVKCGPRKNHRR